MIYDVTKNTAPSSSVYANIITKTKRAQFRNILLYAYTISCDFQWFDSYIKTGNQKLRGIFSYITSGLLLTIKFLPFLLNVSFHNAEINLHVIQSYQKTYYQLCNCNLKSLPLINIRFDLKRISIYNPGLCQKTSG